MNEDRLFHVMCLDKINYRWQGSLQYTWSIKTIVIGLDHLNGMSLQISLSCQKHRGLTLIAKSAVYKKIIQSL